jgi:hypothetical protein
MHIDRLTGIQQQTPLDELMKNAFFVLQHIAASTPAARGFVQRDRIL